MPTLDIFDLCRLRARLESHLRRRPGDVKSDCELFSISLDIDPLPVGTLPPVPAPYFYKTRPDRNTLQLGLGEVWRHRARGHGRFGNLADRLARLNERWLRLADTADLGPGLFCALAFDPDDAMTGPWNGFPNSLLLVPRLLLQSDRGRSTLTLTCRADELRNTGAVLEDWLGLIAQLAGAVRAAGVEKAFRGQRILPFTAENGDAWTGMAAKAIRAIRSGRIDKVVPARRIQINASEPLRASVVLRRLAQLYPSCQLFAVNLGGNTVVSATPERLAALHKGRIACDALGGTTSRSPDPRQDRKLALRLLNSGKAQHEHALVVNAIESALNPLCSEMSVPENPAIIRLRNVQHLWTEITGELQSGINLLDAAGHLHPTPAVAGTPTDAACRWLQQHEKLVRGWYSGTVGWLQPDGDGELSVLLRCAVLDGCTANLFAGAGIVADSNPGAELLETNMKLESILEALQVQREAIPATAHTEPAEHQAGCS